jgi:hypothetical protein
MEYLNWPKNGRFDRLIKENSKFNQKILQWKPLNVITLGQAQTDNINRMITISDLQYNGHLTHFQLSGCVCRCVGKEHSHKFE